MALLVQHGHAKSDKIDSALEMKIIEGVVFGARNEKAENINACVESVHAMGGHVLIDTQFNVSAISPANDRFLPEYPFYKAGRTAADFIGIKKLASYVKSTLDYQVMLNPDRLLSPSVIFESFESNWCQTALNLADASLDYHSELRNPPPLLLTFIIGEQALASRVELDAFLDQLTSWENLFGVYLVIAREEKTYSQMYDPERLANALYMSYVLGKINSLEVVNGYSDFAGLLYRSVGSNAFATGWSQGLRQFHRRSFTKQPPGGQPPKLRYTSIPLLNSILLSELQQIHEVGRLQDVLSGVSLDSVITDASSPEESDWSPRISELHHWEGLHTIDQIIESDVKANLAAFETRIDSAKELYVQLAEDGVVFGTLTRSNHLDQWSEAIYIFQNAVSL
jgi:hypothetical protein